MTLKRTIGGDRVGSGAKMKVEMKTYERSTHDLGYIWRSTMAAGTLVPFLKQVALPGDTFDITLDASVLTHPTIGPLFGSAKVQLDAYLTPIRLYQAQLHNNKLGIGNDMSTVKLPQLYVERQKINTTDVDNAQMNPSALLSYLGMRGVGNTTLAGGKIARYFNAVPLLAYWDIYKNYYANKEENIGAFLHTEPTPPASPLTEVKLDGTVIAVNTGTAGKLIQPNSTVTVKYSSGPPPDGTLIYLNNSASNWISLANLFETITYGIGQVTFSNPKTLYWTINFYTVYGGSNSVQTLPKIQTFTLTNIDDMRESILQAVKQTTQFTLDHTSISPYGDILKSTNTGQYASSLYSQEGLALKTYQSDLFNNWMRTEWQTSITTRSAINTSGGSFTIDQLNLSKKVYDLLNRVAISGGTYEDWLETVWTHEGTRKSETPMYMGGLSKELIFQEVVSNSQSDGTQGAQPLGTLAGRGILGKKHKGGKVVIKVDEPSYIMGLISITPRLDYSQGNDWDTNLLTMDDFHKPALDQIGFQDLITEQMAYWTTTVSNADGNNFVKKSAGKQPAWINYMTNVNKSLGNFAIKTNEMFMTFNRRYEANADFTDIKDLTTYIDPTKFNHIFAQTSIDAQNFWVQIAVDITARRKMSAKIMPNL